MLTARQRTFATTITAVPQLSQLNLKNKRVLCRFDLNVPLSKDTGAITDTARIDAVLPTVEHILDSGASSLTMMSHLGRPKGEPNPAFSLRPVADYLKERLGQDVAFVPSCTEAPAPAA